MKSFPYSSATTRALRTEYVENVAADEVRRRAEICLYVYGIELDVAARQQLAIIIRKQTRLDETYWGGLHGAWSALTTKLPLTDVVYALEEDFLSMRDWTGDRPDHVVGRLSTKTAELRVYVLGVLIGPQPSIFAEKTWKGYSTRGDDDGPAVMRLGYLTRSLLFPSSVRRRRSRWASTCVRRRRRQRRSRWAAVFNKRRHDFEAHAHLVRRLIDIFPVEDLADHAIRQTRLVTLAWTACELYDGHDELERAYWRVIDDDLSRHHDSACRFVVDLARRIRDDPDDGTKWNPRMDVPPILTDAWEKFKVDIANAEGNAFERLGCWRFCACEKIKKHENRNR